MPPSCCDWRRRSRDALDARELVDLYERFELPLVRVLARMEDAGIRIDREFLEALRADLQQQCDEYVRRIYVHAGEEFNVNSTPQLRVILFDKLGLVPQKKTKTGPSTDADSLQKLADEHPIVDDLLRYREVEKLRSTYADALPPLIRADGRVHATFKQTDTTTGRISSEAPNLQNVPVRTADGREMRRAFIAADGCGLLTADYSQIELRILAHVAEDPGLIDAFERGADVHTTTAAKVFHVSEADVDDAQRRFAKVVNYGLAYGMEAYGLGQRLDIPTGEAAQILDAYFAGFPNVREFMQRTVQEAKERGFTTTIFGRRRTITELQSDNFRIRQMGERMAQNAPVQGSAADVFKLAMIELDDALERSGSGARMLLTVHDELVLEVPVDERDATEATVRDVMENVAELRVPLVVDIGFGPNWASKCQVSASTARVSVERAEPGWFDEVAAFLGTAYLRNAFTMGTEQEVDFLVGELGLEPGMRVLDVGCGPGRHSLALSRRGSTCSGSTTRPSSSHSPVARPPTSTSAPPSTSSTSVPSRSATSSTRCCACARAASASSAAGTSRPSSAGSPLRCGRADGSRSPRSRRRSRCDILEDGESFDPATGVLHELATVRDPDGAEREFDLWTTCFTGRELELLAASAGLAVECIAGVAPGKYSTDAPTLAHPELLLLARRPHFPVPGATL